MFIPSAVQIWAGKVQDAELQYTADGTALFRCTVRYQQRDRVDGDGGEKIWKTVNKWSPKITAWGNLAETLNGLLKKGMTVIMWTSYARDRKETDGDVKYYDNYTLQFFQILDWSSDTDDESDGVATSVADEDFDADTEDDVPF